VSPKPTDLDRAALSGDSARVARFIANELLGQVKKKSEDLQADDEPEALHDFRVAVRRLRSWLRAFDAEVGDTLAGKHRRRLGRLADATRVSRDLEVHIDWIENFARARRKKNQAGTAWLIKRLEAKKARADLELRQVLDDYLESTVAGIDKALGKYTVTIGEPRTSFAHVTADLLRSHAVAARTALGRVTNIGDRVEAHEARIAAKRLRYLLEPLRSSVDRVDDLVKRLSQLQDDFGSLHDAQVFGSEIARLLAKVLTSRAEAAAEPDADASDTAADADQAEMLLAISRRLHRDEESTFARARESWLGDQSASLWTDVESVASELDAIAADAHRVERVYLLREVPDQTPPSTVVIVDLGFVAGEGVSECVSRVSNEDGAHYRRTLETTRGLDSSSFSEETSQRVFAALWPLTKGHRLRARRRVVESDGHRWTIDELSEHDVVLARVSLSDPRELAAIPDWLEPVVERDVTDDDNYNAWTLAGARRNGSRPNT
jgi:CHAD domain-containing protein